MISLLPQYYAISENPYTWINDHCGENSESSPTCLTHKCIGYYTIPNILGIFLNPYS